MRRQGRERVNLALAAAAFHAVIGFKGTATAAVGREREGLGGGLVTGEVACHSPSPANISA